MASRSRVIVKSRYIFGSSTLAVSWACGSVDEFEFELLLQAANSKITTRQSKTDLVFIRRRQGAMLSVSHLFCKSCVQIITAL